MSPEHSVDVDDLEDFACAEQLLEVECGVKAKAIRMSHLTATI